MRASNPTATNPDLKNIYDQGITALGVARDFILPEFVTNPAEATYASIGVDLVGMFPMARLLKGGMILKNYFSYVDRMGVDDIKKELKRLNKGRNVNKTIFSTLPPDLRKNAKQKELVFSNAIVKKLGDRREQLNKLDTAEKLMGTAGDGSKIIPRFSFGGGVGSFFTDLFSNSQDDRVDEEVIVVGERPNPIDYGGIVDAISTGLDIFELLNPRPEMVYSEPAAQANMGIASMMPPQFINTGGGSDIRLADYMTELERRALVQQMLSELLG